MDITQTVQVGQTALFIPRMGLGTAPLANLYEAISERQAVATIQACLAAGLNFFDTAPLYGSGLAEQRLAVALKDTPRDAYVMATKIGRLVQPDGGIRFDFSRDGVLKSLEESLTRLGLDYVDIVHIHEPDGEAADEPGLREAFPILADLRRQGVIKAIGAGMNRWHTVIDFVRDTDFDCFLLAGRYTLLEQESLPFLSLCQEKGISLFLAGVLNSGILATGPGPTAKYNYRVAPSVVQEKARRLQAVCARFEVALSTAALQFALAHQATTSLVVGAISPDEVQANTQAFQTQIPAEFWAALKTEDLLDAQAPTP